MKLLAQRGNSNFLVEDKDRYIIVNTRTKIKTIIESPDVLYRQGYCVEPEPTKEQMDIITKIL